MYCIHRHIEHLKSKSEDWEVKCLEFIRDEFAKGSPFDISQETIDKLHLMELEKLEIRDRLVTFSLDYQSEWSKLIIIENVRKYIERALEGKDEKFD